MPPAPSAGTWPDFCPFLAPWLWPKFFSPENEGVGLQPSRELTQPISTLSSQIPAHLLIPPFFSFLPPTPTCRLLLGSSDPHGAP